VSATVSSAETAPSATDPGPACSSSTCRIRGAQRPLWPYFPDVKIERFHYHAKSGVLSQQITTFMHCTTHTDAPAHVIEGAAFIDEVPLSSYFAPASSCRSQGEVGGDHRRGLENATPEIREGDIVIVNTGWHRYWATRANISSSPGTTRSR